MTTITNTGDRVAYKDVGEYSPVDGVAEGYHLRINKEGKKLTPICTH